MMRGIGLFIVAMAELGVMVLKLIRPLLPYLVILGLIVMAIKYWWVSLSVAAAIVLLVLLLRLATRRGRKAQAETIRRRAAERAEHMAGVRAEGERLQEAARSRQEERDAAWAQHEAATTEQEKAAAWERYRRVAELPTA